MPTSPSTLIGAPEEAGVYGYQAPRFRGDGCKHGGARPMRTELYNHAKRISFQNVEAVLGAGPNPEAGILDCHPYHSEIDKLSYVRKVAEMRHASTVSPSSQVLVI
jgi:hypothetical protein